MRFRSAAIDQIARMICGDVPLPFPYRTANAIADFFSGLGLECVNAANKSRNPWCRETLTSINNESPFDGESPSTDMVLVIEELMNRAYFDAAPAGKADYSEALRRINLILRQSDLEVIPDTETGKASLRSIDGSFISTASGALESVRRITFSPSVFRLPKEIPQNDLVSVMMPFAAEFDPVYAAIRSACCSKGLRCKRADDIWANSIIIQDIFDLVFVSFIVVVDFTGRNPNVMYETGIAHTLGKNVVPITQSMDDVPFDLQSHRVLRYLLNDQGLEKLRDDLASRLSTLVEGYSWSE
jgi:hypothetical protein